MAEMISKEWNLKGFVVTWLPPVTANYKNISNKIYKKNNTLNNLQNKKILSNHISVI